MKNIKITNRLYKFASATSIIWLLCVVTVISILALATQFMTHDPDLAPGEPENVYLLPLLASTGIGFIAFLLTASGGFLSFFSGGKFEPLFRWKIRYSTVLVTFLLFGAISFLFGYRQANIANYGIDTSYTGQDIFDAINAHRQSLSLDPIVLEPTICDNLVQRQLDLANPENQFRGHVGFEDWAVAEKLDQIYPELAEMYTKEALSPQEAIDWWKGSPGHRLTLEGDYDVGCAYANDGVAVVVFGKKSQ